MDTDGGPQADDGGEQGLINDGRLMINDFVHTENTEGNGGPQADGFVGKQQLSSIGQQLKEKIFFNCRYIAGNCCSRKRVGGLWSAIAINDQQLKEYIYIDGHRWRSASGRWRGTSFDYSHIVYIKRSSSSYASF